MTDQWIDQKIEAIANQMIAWRRHIHQHPELEINTYQTAKYIQEQLKDLPLSFIEDLEIPGVVAILKKGSSDKVLALRADIDALPIQEESEISYKSLHPGTMHACGHDGHASILMATAHLAAEMDFDGSLILIFQPGEEKPGGARLLIEQGLLHKIPKPDYIFALHLWSGIPTGVVGVRSGPIMASTDTFDITIKGTGGHAAFPHQCVDPIPIAADVIQQLQTIISRKQDPFIPSVISITQIHSGNSYNIIPTTATIKGTIRTLDPDMRKQLPEQMEHMVNHICHAHNATAEISFQWGYPVTVNDNKAADFLRQVIKKAIGEDNFKQGHQTLGGEDFSYFLEQIPGAFMELGTSNPSKQTNFPLHNPRFNIDEDSLSIGLKVFIYLIRDFFQYS